MLGRTLSRLADSLHYNYFRDYDPVVGRYKQSDPIGLGGGINTYGYADQQPVLTTDELGLASCCQQSYGECFQKCLQERLRGTREFADKLTAAVVGLGIATTPVRIVGVGVRGPALQVFAGLTGRSIGGAIAGAVGRSLGGSIGAFGGRLGIYGIATTGAFLLGYGTGTLGYCGAVCAGDNCYFQ
jgi:RHS repeat-associated protein